MSRFLRRLLTVSLALALLTLLTPSVSNALFVESKTELSLENISSETTEAGGSFDISLDESEDSSDRQNEQELEGQPVPPQEKDDTPSLPTPIPLMPAPIQVEKDDSDVEDAPSPMILPPAPIEVTAADAVTLRQIIAGVGSLETVIDVTATIDLSSYNDMTIGSAHLYAALIIEKGQTITIKSSNGSKLIKTNPGVVGDSYRHIAVKGKLTLQNITLDGGNASGGVQVVAGTVEGSGGNAVFGAGTLIENCRSSYHGGGVHVEAYATASMNAGAKIRNCVAWGPSVRTGGGVCLHGASAGIARFTMNGGEISANSATSSDAAAAGGGGVYVSSGEFTMNDGVISDNSVLTSNGGGGGVYVIRGTAQFPAQFTMKGGKIINNTANNGGGVGISSSIADATVPSKFIMAGGEISGNRALKGNGGGVLINPAIPSELTMTGGEISGNTAENGNGGGVFVGWTSGSTYGKLAMTGGEISGNHAPKGDGGGIFTQNTMYLGTGNYTNISVSLLALFKGNTASAQYITKQSDISKTAANIASRSASFVFPDSTTHPLNNYDINYKAFHAVTIKYEDRNGVTLKDPVTTQVLQNTEYSYTVPDDIPEYKLVAWKQDTTLHNDKNPATTLLIMQDTTITLIYSNTTILQLSKVDSKTRAPLAGATFNLYLWKGTGSIPETVFSASGDLTNTGWTLVETSTSALSTGLVTFADLVGGEYQLVETQAPNGYRKPPGQWRISISVLSLDQIQITPKGSPPPASSLPEKGDEQTLFLISNSQAFEMPVAGGPGISDLIIFGGVLTVIPLVSALRFSRKKMDARLTRK